MADKDVPSKSWADATEEEDTSTGRSPWGSVPKPEKVANLRDPEKEQGARKNDDYDDRRGGYDDRRGGYDDRRGGGRYDDRRGGGYDDRRGGGGGYDDRRGGGGYDDRRGYGNRYDGGDRGYDRRPPRRDRAPNPIPTEPPFKMYVGNLSYKVDESHLADLLDGLQVSDINVVRDNDQSKGYGYVEFGNADDLGRAIEGCNGYDLEGRSIRCDVADPRPARDEGYRRPMGSRQHDDRGDRSYGGYDETGRRQAPTMEDLPEDEALEHSEGRRKLALKPRTAESAPLARADLGHKKPDPFAGAKPRDEREIEARLEKERAEREKKLQELEAKEAKEEAEKEGDEKDEKKIEKSGSRDREDRGDDRRPYNNDRRSYNRYDREDHGDRYNRYDDRRGGGRYDDSRGGGRYDDRGGYDRPRRGGGYRGGYGNGPRRGGRGRGGYGGGRFDDRERGYGANVRDDRGPDREREPEPNKEDNFRATATDNQFAALAEAGDD